MRHRLQDSRAILGRTPRVLRTLLTGLPESLTHANEGPETWSPFDVVGHLIDGEETDWMDRARIILRGEEREFDPFDRFRHFRRNQGMSLEDLLDRFEALRAGNLEELDGWDLTAEELALTGGHPELGEVTLDQLLATWAAHDLGHLVQVSRAMARQYREAVGPWAAYLSVMDDRPEPT